MKTITESMYNDLSDLTFLATSAIWGNQLNGSLLTSFFTNPDWRDEPVMVMYIPTSEIMVVNGVIHPLMPETFLELELHTLNTTMEMETLMVRYVPNKGIVAEAANKEKVMRKVIPFRKG